MDDKDHCQVSTCSELRYNNSTEYCCRHAMAYKLHGDPLYRKSKGHTEGYTNTTEHPLYGTWCAMKNRVYNPKAWDYKYYGGSGVKVSDRWLESFSNFVDDMGEKPGPKYTLDRTDPTGDYSPENCRWASIYTQARNKKPRGSSNVTGVCYSKTSNRWIATLIMDGKKIHCSYHRTEKEAINYRRAAELNALLVEHKR